MRRRDFLWTGALPFADRGRSKSAPENSCILLKLTGGPSHIDTWDPKPEAPVEIRGPFRAIETTVRGMRISELFPRMAEHAEQYSLIRSLCSGEPARHETPSNPDQADPRSFGARCRDAVRSVEDGARFVSVEMFDPVFEEITWDMHGWGPFSSMTSYRDTVAPMFDAAFSSMLEELAGRGLLSKTLVVAMGEFGRSPTINPSGGRDHWPHCFTAIMAGGGIRGGQVYGRSDALGAYPLEKPVMPAMVEATIRKALHWPPTGALPLDELFS